MSQYFERFEMVNNQPKLHVPEDACDCHMHVYESRFPLTPTAISKPPEAPVEEYQKVQRR